MALVGGEAFKRRQFTGEIILWVVQWYLMFPVSYRDLELMLQDRGVAVDHTTIFRWIQAYAAQLERGLSDFPRMRWFTDQARALVKRSPKNIANWAFAMVHSRGGTIHSFSALCNTRNSSLMAASSLGRSEDVV